MHDLVIRAPNHLGDLVMALPALKEARPEAVIAPRALTSLIELAGFNGGSIRIESIRSDLPPMPRLDSDGRLNVRFGGVIHLSGDADGDFRGDARIEVEYF